MDYLDFGDTIDYNKFNALVYLLRKFKKLTSELELGAYDINTDYGNFHFTDGFVPVGNNWILEDNVTVTGSNVLLNSFYTFVFTVVDVNTSGVVNKRLIRVTSESTGETGTLELTIPSDLIGTDEVILPNFTLEVVFDEHEYYTQLPDVHLSLSVDKMGIRAGEVATITGLLTDSTSTPIENVSLPLNVDGTTVTVITDSTGEFNYAYTGTGTRGKVLVSALGESVYFYDGLINILAAIVTGNNVSLGGYNPWLITTGDVVIYWGDGTSDTVNNPRGILSHTYADGLNEHLIIFDGTVTSLGYLCFYHCSGLTSIVIPDSVTSLGVQCFDGCSGLTSVVIPDSVTSLRDLCFRDCSDLTSVTIPDSVTSIGNHCFDGCTGLTTYDLYWESNPVAYDSNKMRINTNTVFNIPYGKTQLYVDANYPSARLVERGSHNYQLSVVSDKDIISNTEVATLTATLSDNSIPVSGETLNYVVEHNGSVLDSGSVVTGSDGTASISYTGTGVGDIEVIVSYGTLLQETFVIEDTNYYDVSSQSNLSNYSIGSDVSFSYDSSNSAYLIYPTSVGVKFVTLNNKSFNKDNKISIDFNITSSQNNAQIGFVLGNLGVRCIYAGQQTLRIYRISISNSALNNDYTYRDCNVNFNTWYTLELLPTGVLNLKQGNTIVATCNYDISSLLSDNNSLKLYIGFDTDTRILLRNIKVKAL